ncbi:MAG: hypothetical protein M3167_06335 [Acidobacteriota bacterium]|nr:hypothetical protein [Acidobacteriota bacterium]MDQ6892282.1 hypothetical protein [Acidobacteriota bacterium]
MFAASDLVTAAKARFGATNLQQRVAPGASTPLKDLELLKIAQGVIDAFSEAAQNAGLWPLAGVWPAGSVSPLDGTTDVSGQPYANVWPYNMTQRALDYFDGRSYGALEVIPSGKLQMLKAVDAFLLSVAKGAIGLGTSGLDEPSTPRPIASRDRSGRSLTADGAQDRRNLLDTFIGAAWDWWSA